MKNLVQMLEGYGFDRSKAIPFESGAIIGCSQCEATCINGVPCHETGCPNATKECRGCDTTLSRRGSDYCADCR